MRDGESCPTASAGDDDDDEDYEESGGGNGFLGFMFGNVDDSGDLDADYLDEDVKEHLFALADDMGQSLKDIDLTRSSPPALIDPSDEQAYDEKAEDAVDFEDIDEEYDGPEVEAATEEDNVLSRKDYFSSNGVYALVNSTVSVFDEENYDEDEGMTNDEFPVSSAVQNCSSDAFTGQAVMDPSNINLATEKIDSSACSEECMDFEHEISQVLSTTGLEPGTVA